MFGCVCLFRYGFILLESFNDIDRNKLHRYMCMFLRRPCLHSTINVVNMQKKLINRTLHQCILEGNERKSIGQKKE